ncbi:MAG: YfhO family protein [Chitinophagaceae bacterium]
MNKRLLKTLVPHMIAIVVFLIVSVVFCKPVLEGKTLQQHDIIGAQGMSQNSHEHYEKYGNYPLWNTNLFSGMPNYQVLVKGPDGILVLYSILTLGLPKPISFFFLACICFYFLALALRVNPYIGIFGALAYAFITYNPVIISAGHDTKMMAIAFAPGLIAGLILLYEGKYILGLAVTAAFASLQTTSNHPQISYYLFIVLAFMTISYIITWFKAKQFKHMGIALALAFAGAVIGVLNAAFTLFPTYEYAKYTMRGGKTIETTEAGAVESKTTGLDKDYAFRWSINMNETVTLFMPKAFGESSGEAYTEDSKLVEELIERNIPEASATQLATQLPKYWGGMALPGEGTSGPVYLGIVCFLLFLIGYAVLDTHHRWWIFAAFILSAFMAWGKYFIGFNNILFDALPLYNKFRAPSMALVMIQFVVPFLTILTLQKIIFDKDARETVAANFKFILYVLGGLIGLLLLMYLVMDYKSGMDGQILDAFAQNAQGGENPGVQVINALKASRQQMFGSGIIRVLIYSLLLVGLLYLWKRKSLSPVVFLSIILLVNTTDLFATGKNYLNEDNYIDKESYTDVIFSRTEADNLILADKDPHFRVYNLAPDRFNESRTSYFHRSIGGYHPAKLRLYQDLIENQLSKDQLNMDVMRMLDVKYFLFNDQQGRQNVQPNDTTMGAAWFVQELQPVSNPVEEINSLDQFNPAETAFIQKDQMPKGIQPTFNRSGTIALTKYVNDEIVYTTESPSNQFAVFSEIYYPAGWNAYLDGNKTDYYKVNYLLRGMPVPAGKHTIMFKFEPGIYYTSYTLALIGNILLYLMLAAAVVYAILRYRNQGSTISERKKEDVL